MRPAVAWCAVAALLAVTAAGLILPTLPLAILAAASVGLLRTRRATFALFAVVSIAINVLLFGLLVRGGQHWDFTPFEHWDFTPFTVSALGLQRGLVGGLRLVAVMGANLAILSWFGMARILDGLHLPASVTAFLAAVLIAAHDLGRDAQRLVAARRLDGQWPKARMRRIAASATLAAPLMVLALRRGNQRRDALRLAGHDMGPRFAALTGLTALAAVGRLLDPVPNVSLTFVVVFLAGYLFGATTGALVGLLSMLITNLVISGFHPVLLANAPAMAVVGVLGAGLARVRLTGATLRVAAACCGIIGTVLFSLSADLLAWSLIPEYRAVKLGTYVLAGQAFNVVPAIIHAVLFAAATGPVARAAHAAGLVATSPNARVRTRPREART